VSVRDARPEDLDVICELLRDHAAYEGGAGLITVDRAGLGVSLFGAEPAAFVLVAEAPGEPDLVAGIAMWSVSSWAGRGGIWLENLFVRPEYRRGGLGRALLTTLRGRTTGRVEWDVALGNPQADAFYRSLGALPVDGWRRYRWEPRHP
jgi:GNAT superfamily N-acetyltransferase